MSLRTINVPARFYSLFPYSINYNMSLLGICDYLDIDVCYLCKQFITPWKKCMYNSNCCVKTKCCHRTCHTVCFENMLKNAPENYPLNKCQFCGGDIGKKKRNIYNG
jgi:hypothetical protein